MNPEYEWVVRKGCHLKSVNNPPTQSKSVYKYDCNCTQIEETIRTYRQIILLLKNLYGTREKQSRRDMCLNKQNSKLP
jgi:hypothetical protein